MTPREWSAFVQWDASRRLMMVLHPGHGLTQAGMILGSWRSDLKPGWNVSERDSLSIHRRVWTYIGEKEGKSTTNPAEVPAGADVHHAPNAPPNLHSSEIWSILRRTGEEVGASGGFGLSPDDVLATLGSIEYFSKDLRHRNFMKSWAMEAIGAMRAALKASRSGQVRTGDFLAPMFDVVDAYLGFRIPGSLAAELLTVILASQCTRPPTGRPNLMPNENRMAAAEHLADLSYQLLSRRATKNLKGFFELSYLASLYTKTAHYFCEWGGEAGSHSASEEKRLRDMALNVDEIFAHKISPCFLIPALFAPCDVVKYAQGYVSAEFTLDQFAEYWQIHPGIFKAISTIGPERDSDEIAADLMRLAGEGEDFDARAAVRGEEAAPIAPQNLEAVTMAVLAMSLGGA